MLNRFFIYEDEQIKQMDEFEIPQLWWSRPFEYAFASQFLSKNDVVCDAGCGIEHPFKYYASKRVNELIAVDNDKRIEEIKGIKTNCIDIKELGDKYKGYFDKIFCISVLEHDIPNLKDNLKSFEKAIKNDGLIILTMDFPLIKPEQVINMLEDCNLKIHGEYDYKEPDRMLRGYYSNLSCFSMILEKLTKKIEPKEKKPFKPSETK